ncbi:MAG TPA: hypothetical protein VND64_21390 [Pirellulales bacterium]|nr:hypothetical protein [Pirellulales bacterium]
MNPCISRSPDPRHLPIAAADATDLALADSFYYHPAAELAAFRQGGRP